MRVMQIMSNANIGGEEVFIMLPCHIKKVIDNSNEARNYDWGITQKKVVGYRCIKKLLAAIREFPVANITVYLPAARLIDDGLLEKTIKAVGRNRKVKTIKLVDFDIEELKRFQ